MPLKPDDKLLLNSLLQTEASRERLRLLVGEGRASIDWAVALRRASFHHTSALLRFNLAQAGLLNAVPQDFRSELDDISRTWAARHLAYTAETVRLIAALIGAGVSALPLKGAALMLGGYYPQAGLRAASDIDLLVSPGHLHRAGQVAGGCGYFEIPGRRSLRSRQRLENEHNHSWPRRGPSGLILELHHRAFHFAKGGRDFGFADMHPHAVAQKLSDGRSLVLPSASDLAVHLIHHTMVDLQSTDAILRTMADLHFVFARDPQARERVKERAREIGFAGAAELAIRVLHLLEDGALEDLDKSARDRDIALLLDTALMESPSPLAEAARLFEYFDFSRHPVEKLGNLFSLLFTPRSHLEQIYGGPANGSVYFNYLRRPFNLMKRFNWESLSPATLRRVWSLRRISSRTPGK